MAENLANLHVVGRTADGRLWHTMRSPTGWTPFSDVLLNAGLFTQSVHVVDVACARRLLPQCDQPSIEPYRILHDQRSWSAEL